MKRNLSRIFKPDGKTAEQQLIGALADDKGMSLPDFTEEDDEPEN